MQQIITRITDTESFLGVAGHFRKPSSLQLFSRIFGASELAASCPASVVSHRSRFTAFSRRLWWWINTEGGRFRTEISRMNWWTDAAPAIWNKDARLRSFKVTNRVSAVVHSLRRLSSSVPAMRRQPVNAECYVSSRESTRTCVSLYCAFVSANEVWEQSPIKYLAELTYHFRRSHLMPSHLARLYRTLSDLSTVSTIAKRIRYAQHLAKINDLPPRFDCTLPGQLLRKNADGAIRSTALPKAKTVKGRRNAELFIILHRCFPGLFWYGVAAWRSRVIARFILNICTSSSRIHPAVTHHHESIDSVLRKNTHDVIFWHQAPCSEEFDQSYVSVPAASKLSWRTERWNPASGQETEKSESENSHLKRLNTHSAISVVDDRLKLPESQRLKEFSIWTSRFGALHRPKIFTQNTFQQVPSPAHGSSPEQPEATKVSGIFRQCHRRSALSASHTSECHQNSRHQPNICRHAREWV